jgi:hypothetical protein
MNVQSVDGGDVAKQDDLAFHDRAGLKRDHRQRLATSADRGRGEKIGWRPAYNGEQQQSGLWYPHPLPHPDRF